MKDNLDLKDYSDSWSSIEVIFASFELPLVMLEKVLENFWHHGIHSFLTDLFDPAIFKGRKSISSPGFLTRHFLANYPPFFMILKLYQLCLLRTLIVSRSFRRFPFSSWFTLPLYWIVHKQHLVCRFLRPVAWMYLVPILD